MNKNFLKIVLLSMLISMFVSESFAYDIAAKNADGVWIYYCYINDGKELSVVRRDYNKYYNDAVINIPEEVIYNGSKLRVTSIGPLAFFCSYKLTSLTIPNSVTVIGSGAFDNCTNLKSINIPYSVKNINVAFELCTSLTSISVDKNNPIYDSRNNCNAIIESSTNELLLGCKNTIIPNSVTSIGGCAFSGCKDMSSIIIPNSVTSIGNSAFYGCRGMTNFSIPSSVTSIGEGAFSSCQDLIEISISQNLEEIGFDTFYLCTNLTSIHLPNNLKKIGDRAFQYCFNLTSLFLPNGVIEIGDEAFSSCSNLESLTIPSSIKKIGKSIISGCYMNDIYCLATDIPETDLDAFKDKPDATLHVPSYSLYDYQNTKPWNCFYSIVPFDTSNMKGDVNNDGNVDFNDLDAIKEIIMTGEIGNYNAKNADVNSDEKINVADIVETLNILLK